MKAVICETSPLLLIDKPRKDWPTLPSKEVIDFSSLYTSKTGYIVGNGGTTLKTIT